MPKVRVVVLAAILLSSILIAAPGAALEPQPVPDWPALYDPFTMLDYHMVMTEANWETIRHDLSYDIEVPTLFWAEDESPILVSVRRKSADSLPLDDPANPEKVSLKIDINEYVDACDGSAYGFPGATCVDMWHGVKKLSLENGDDNNVVTEGFAYYLHQIASEQSGLDYVASKTSWINMEITLTERVDADGNTLPDLTFNNGVFVNVQQRDKQFLKNHGLWDGNDTWLYKYSDPYEPEIDEWPEDVYPEPVDSPAFVALNYAPFQECGRRSNCDEPSAEQFVEDLQAWINMEGMLTFAAVSAFHISPDDLISKGKNFFFVDYSSTDLGKREYIQWDLDSAFSGMDVTADIYEVGDRKFGDYEDWIIDNPVFNEQYAEIMRTLLGGPFNEADLLAAVTAIEAEIGPALSADPNNQLGDSVPGWFDAFRAFLSSRIANVQSQVPGDPPSPPEDTIHVGDMDGVSTKVGKFDWFATVTVTVHDDQHQAVPGATVYGSWSGDWSGEASCTIADAGTCSVVTDVLGKLQRNVAFTIHDVEATGLAYEATLNHDPDGDSDGTTIGVSKP